MGNPAESFQFSPNDVARLSATGYQFAGIAQAMFAIFMRQNYPVFDLCDFILQAEALMIPHASTPLKRCITVKDKELRVRFENDFTGEDDALIFDRRFYWEQNLLKVSHEFLVLPKSARNQDLSKKVLHCTLEHYLKIGVSTIEVIAGLSSGAFVWARAGFVAVNRDEMSQILARAKSALSETEYKLVEILYDAYYQVEAEGNSFPIRRWADLPFMQPVLMKPASQWQGRLDLTNPEQLRNFIAYVSRYKK